MQVCLTRDGMHDQVFMHYNMEHKQSEQAHLAGPHEVVERLHGLLDGHIRVESVDDV